MLHVLVRFRIFRFYSNVYNAAIMMYQVSASNSNFLVGSISIAIFIRHVFMPFFRFAKRWGLKAGKWKQLIWKANSNSVWVFVLYRFYDQNQYPGRVAQKQIHHLTFWTIEFAKYKFISRIKDVVTCNHDCK